MARQLAIICTTLLAVSFSIDGAHWGYSGDHGQHHWGETFPVCGQGDSQSPINIQTKDAEYSEHLDKLGLTVLAKKKGSQFHMINNGHSVKVSTKGLIMLTGGNLPHVYRVAQFHFHWGSTDNQGSEHTLNGAHYPLEMHIVSYDAEKYNSLLEAATEKDGLAVTGVFFKLSKHDNKHLDPIVDNLPKVKSPDDGTVPIGHVNLHHLLPLRTQFYYRYHGSLTTPGCYESVIWTVLDMPQTVSAAQLNQFRSLTQGHNKSLLDNFRHTQPLNGRQVERSFPHHIEYVIIENIITEIDGSGAPQLAAAGLLVVIATIVTMIS